MSDSQYLKAEEVTDLTEKDVVLPAASSKMNKSVKVRIKTLDASMVLSGSPEIVPGTDDFAKLLPAKKRDVNIEWNNWGNVLIHKSLINPKMSVEQVAGLGEDRTLLFNEVMTFCGLAGQPTGSFRPEERADDKHGGEGDKQTAA